MRDETLDSLLIAGEQFVDAASSACGEREIAGERWLYVPVEEDNAQAYVSRDASNVGYSGRLSDATFSGDDRYDSHSGRASPVCCRSLDVVVGPSLDTKVIWNSLKL